MTKAQLLRLVNEADAAADDLLAQLSTARHQHRDLRAAIEADGSLLQPCGVYIGTEAMTKALHRLVNVTARLRAECLREALHREQVSVSKAARQLGISRQRLTRVIGRKR